MKLYAHWKCGFDGKDEMRDDDGIRKEMARCILLQRKLAFIYVPRPI